MGKKQTMPLSAIYPRHFGIAVQHVLDWTQRAVDNRALEATAAIFAADLPTPEEAYAAAVRDGSRCHFNDHDPGWRGMHAELPPKTTKVQRKLLFQRKRDVAGAEAVIVEVVSSDDEQDRTETSAGSCLELFTGAFPLVFDPAVSATQVVLKQVLEQQLALFFGPGHTIDCTNLSAATSSRSLLDGLAQSWRAHSKYKFQRAGDALLRVDQARWKLLVARIQSSRCQPRKTAFACSCCVSVSADYFSWSHGLRRRPRRQCRDWVAKT